MLCEVCEVCEAVGRCRLCGRYVCGNHVDANGLCSVCRETLCSICHIRLSVGNCLICGRIICRECSVELQPSIRVCSECYDKILNNNSYVKYRKLLRRFVRDWRNIRY